MNMVFMSANLYRKPFQVFTYSADIIVKIVFDRIIDQVFSVFRAEYYMRVHFRERLWHRTVLSGLRPQGFGMYHSSGLSFMADAWRSALHYVIDFSLRGKQVR